MKLSECKIGTIVTNNKELHKKCTDSFDKLLGFVHYKPFERIGYICGLTQNATKETIPLIVWSDQENTKDSIHHANIDIYED